MLDTLALIALPAPHDDPPRLEYPLVSAAWDGDMMRLRLDPRWPAKGEALRGSETGSGSTVRKILKLKSEDGSARGGAGDRGAG